MNYNCKNQSCYEELRQEFSNKRTYVDKSHGFAIPRRLPPPIRPPQAAADCIRRTLPLNLQRVDGDLPNRMLRSGMIFLENRRNRRRKRTPRRMIISGMRRFYRSSVRFRHFLKMFVRRFFESSLSDLCVFV